MNLQGKRALITGGSSGIGYAIAEAMLGKGASVAITGRRPDVLQQAAERLRQKGRVEYLAADVSTEDDASFSIEIPRRARCAGQQCRRSACWSPRGHDRG